MKLLTRDQFREAVFERDNNQCVICGETEKLDAHHILERRLWDDGGYYLDNGATLCDKGQSGCHMKAEMTILSCEEIREAAGITTTHIPPHLYRDLRFDKWGNIIQPNETRIKGELFHDPSVQKVLKFSGLLPFFSSYVKYPRTYHLPWSPGATSDDRILESTDQFEGRSIVVTEKMDGECTTLYNDYLHARSTEMDSHPSRARVKKLHAEMSYEIPDGWRICGENVYAKHAIPYENLKSYFLVYSIWDENNYCLPWDETVQYSKMLGLETVPVIREMIWDEDYLRTLGESIDTERQEGYVVRLADGFPYGGFRKSIAKWVRKDHVQTTHNWKRQQLVENHLEKVEIDTD